jgi:osmoprotectant transport system ATP-binding protein
MMHDWEGKMAESVIQFYEVYKKFDNSVQNAVDGISLAVPRGAFITIMGTSGSGKTTLLKMINRILELTSGKITFEGKDIQTLKVEEYRKKIGYVIQQIGLFPHMTVAENISVVPKSLRWEKKQIEERVDYLLKLVHMEPQIYRNRYPLQLSGGQQQRVGLARAMAAEPAVMLMDEPFGAIDALTRQTLQNELLEIQSKLGKTILFVTHDIHEAFKLGEQVIIMNRGKVQQYDTPYNILFSPANDFVKKLVETETVVEKLHLLRADSIAVPITGNVNLSLPKVRENDTLTAVLGIFLETGLPSILVESAGGRTERQILWNSFQSIAEFKKEEIEYYV